MADASKVEMKLPMVAWAAIVHTLQNTPKGVLLPDVQADADALALGKESQLVTLIQDNSEKVGKASKKKGQKYTISLDKEVSTTMTHSQVQVIGAVLQAYVREQEAHRWWCVSAERRVQAALQMHTLDMQAVAVQ